jgi:sarcosine oxidase, subunit beta
MRQDEHVVIIGGGATAALASVRLAERGFRVTVLEKAHIGNGSSSRSNACIRAQFGVAETVTGMMYSEWYYAHFHDLLKTPPEGAQPVIEQNGYLFLYEDPAALPAWEPAERAEALATWRAALDRVAMQQSVGLPVEVLTPEVVQQRWSHLEAERLIGATWCPTDGFLHPHMVYGEGFRRARELGVEVRQGAEVTGARLSGGRIVSVETSGGEVTGDWFVNATNAWAPRVSRRIGGMPLPIAPLKRYLYHLKPSHAVMSAEAWHALPMTIYGMGRGKGVFSRPDGPLLILGISHETSPDHDFCDDDQDRIERGFGHEHGLDNMGYALLAQLEPFAPALADVCGLAGTSCGYYAMTPDATPLIGFDAQQENLLHAAGFSGHGLMHAPITAVLVEALLAGDAHDGMARLPEPFAEHSIALSTFDPRRDFSAHAETMVL